MKNNYFGTFIFNFGYISDTKDLVTEKITEKNNNYLHPLIFNFEYIPDTKEIVTEKHF